MGIGAACFRDAGWAPDCGRLQGCRYETGKREVPAGWPQGAATQWTLWGLQLDFGLSVWLG